MKPEVCCVNTSGLVSYIRRTQGEQGIARLLLGIEGVDEEYLSDANNWISLETLLNLFDNIRAIFDDASPKLFFRLGKELSATQGGALVHIVKWLGNTGSIIRSGPRLNRRFNVDQEMEVVSVTHGNALVINYFAPEFYPREQKDQCEWTKGIIAGIPMLWGLPAAEVEEITCSFNLEDLFIREYSYLGLNTAMEDDIFYVQGQEYARRVTLRQADCGKGLFRDVRGTPPGINRGTTKVFTGEHDRAAGSAPHTGMLVTKTLSVDGREILREGEIYNAPYCLYRITWQELSFLRNLYNRTIGRARLQSETGSELEKLLVLAERRLFEAEDARDELAQLNRDLELKVEERTRQYKEQYDRANRALEEAERLAGQIAEAEKMAAVGRLSFGVGHDLRNTLATAINSGVPLRGLMADLHQVAAMLEEGKPTQDIGQYLDQRKIPERLARAPELYETMMGSLAQALDNIKALEGYAVQDGSDFQEMRIEEVIERVLRDRRGDLEGIQVEISFEERDYSFRGNPLKIYNIFHNLVLNAIEAMKETEEPVLRIETQVKDGVHKTTVEDNGSGMNEEVRKRAFEPFYTTRGLAEARQRGLGLFNVWRLIHQHGGNIEVQSEPGKFTRFQTEFPTTA
jgi:signal transduction histidine kinase